MKSYRRTKESSCKSFFVIRQARSNTMPSQRPPPGRLKTPNEFSRQANLCDQSSNSPAATVIFTSNLFKFLVISSLAMLGVNSTPAASQNEFQLVARAGGQARLPCLIGKQSLCGDPYFIAWYKLNSTSRQWSRVEARSLTASEELAAAPPHPSDRIQFVMPRAGTEPASSSCLPQVGDNGTIGARQQLTYSNRQLVLGGGLAAAAGQKSLAARSFDCGQLTISELDLIDEGQYKCEITFSDSLDFDSCPASTTTQLNVIARPNEPEILLNGKPLVGGQTNEHAAGASLTFKEGAQVRLECQSAGGKPAPRIEWLNLTSVGPIRATNDSPDINAAAAGDDDQSMIDQRRPAPPDRVQVQIMRSYWPIKRASYSIPATNSELATTNNINQAAGQQRSGIGAQIPVTSSTITITLSRFDMRSRFVCLVVPAQWDSSQQHSNGKSYAQSADETARDKNWLGMPEIARNPTRLAELLDQTPMLEAHHRRGDDLASPLLKWIKLDILAKPTSVSMRVLDLATRSLVRPDRSDSLPFAMGPQHEQPPIYSLHPNRAYAIQCLVEDSRPRSQLAWFNRTAPVELEQHELRSSGPDQLVAPPPPGSGHRLTSFVHYARQESGAFRTTASLVLTTNFQDNFDEFFCRVSNEAFQFDELAQVAPIISARLHVNYPPTAWLESPEVKWSEQRTAGTAGRLSGELGQRVQMRCLVGANPLAHNTIVSIDWLKDGRRLAASLASSNSSQQQARLTIEKTNHLHTPLLSQTPQLDLANRISASSVDQQQLAAQASRLLAVSSLTITALSKSDAGQYSCQFRLIPMHPEQQQQVAGSGGSLLTAGPNLSPFQQQQQQMKTITGQANQSIQLNVIEAKLPLVQVASTSGLLVYDKLSASAASLRHAEAKLDKQNLEVVVTGRRAKITLRCDWDTPASERQRGAQFELGHKVLWQLNGAFLHSSTSEQLEIDLSALGQTSDESNELAARLLAGNGGRLTCAHHLLESSSLQAQHFHSQAMRVLGSSNELDLRFKVEPKLLQATRHELLMPPLRSFSELELIAQPLNRLRLVCLAQCEPLCSIDWLANGRPVHELHTASGGGGGELQDASQPPVQMREMADNQTQIFKSTRRLGGALLELENQIHRRTLTSAEHFPWYKQTSLVSGQLQSEPATSQFELSSRQLMRDSYELIQSSGPEAMASNVFSKLELSYNQLSQMLSLVSLAHEQELQLECKLNELLDGRDKQQAAQPEVGAQFGHARVRADFFYPARANELPEDLAEPHSSWIKAKLGLEPLNLSTLFIEEQQVASPRVNRLQTTRVILEKTLRSDSSAPSAFASGNFPILLNPQLANSSHLFPSRPLDNLQAPQGPTPRSPNAKSWLATHLDLVLIVTCSLAFIWLLSLFVSPLMRRHFFARSPSSTTNMLKQKRVMASNHNQHWPRFNQSGSRASSTNEIGLFGGGSSHKFNGGMSAPNYYGAPDSAGGDSSEHDMVQSCSQSSHYEEFIQHQLAQQQRLAAHQQQQQQQVVQPLYFNQAHLVESTTLSRRPLMKSSYSSSSTGGDTSGSSGGGNSRAPLAASRIYGDIRQQPQHPMPSFASTMRHPAQPQVQPLISNATCTSSRINFSDLQRHRQEQQTFGKPPPIPMGRQHLGRMQEHIYDDVS